MSSRVFHFAGLLVWMAVVSMDVRQASADEFVEQTKRRIEPVSPPSIPWGGPISGPAAQTNKQLVFIAADMRNNGVFYVSEGVKAAARVMNWKLLILDGQGSVSERTAALKQVVSLKSAGVILGGFDAQEQRGVLKEIQARGIPIVGWHAGPLVGPIPAQGLFVNIACDPNEVAKLAASYVVTRSDGKAGVVILTDSQYSIATAKSDAMADVINQCGGCSLLAIEDSPLAEASSRMPQLTSSLLQRFGDRWGYTLAINDLYFDFLGPSLSRFGRGPEQPPLSVSGGDGSESAFQRIRQSRYQIATVAEPLALQGWQLVDELNRAFAGASPSGYMPKASLITPDNVEADGGGDFLREPQNDYVNAYRKIWRR